MPGIGSVAVVRDEQIYTNHLEVVIISGVLGHAKVILPVLLQVVDIGPKVLFPDGIDHFRLSVFSWKVVDSHCSILYLSVR